MTTSNAERGAARQARREATREALQTQSDRPIVTRTEAKAQGLVRYFTGAPCNLGHIAERHVKNGCCVVCAKHKHDVWRAANPEKMKAASDAWKTANLTKISARMAADYAKNPERMRQKTRDWRKTNPDKLAVQGANRRARKRAAEGFYTADDVKRIHTAQKGKCACCRKKVGDTYHVDHIQPLSKGGSNWPSNLQILCQSCNLKKHARDPITHMQSLGFLL